MNFLGLGKKQAKNSQTLIFSFKFSRKECPDADVNIQAVKCSPVSKATLIRLAQNIIQVRSDVIVKLGPYWGLLKKRDTTVCTLLCTSSSPEI